MDISTLPANIQDQARTLAIGEVYGPFIEGKNYRAMKVVDRKMVPDSATTRHILINATDPLSFTTAEQRIDSIKTAIEGGASFAELAESLSQDPGSAQNGGKYENIPPNQFVPAYGDIASFGNIGQLYSVRTQYGVHLIEPLSRYRNSTERVQLAYINQAITPSEDTQSRIFDEANDFLANNRNLNDLNTSVASSGALSAQTSPSAVSYTHQTLPTICSV